MLKFVVVYGLIASLHTAAASRQDFINSDLPFGFWFGGHGQVRRQVRADNSPSQANKERMDLMQQNEAKKPKFSERDFYIGEEVLQFLLDKMHQRRKAILRRKHFGLMGRAIRDNIYYSHSKRSPEIVQNLQQYNKNRGLYGFEMMPAGSKHQPGDNQDKLKFEEEGIDMQDLNFDGFFRDEGLNESELPRIMKTQYNEPISSHQHAGIRN